jgi:hypothetical protein
MPRVRERDSREPELITSPSLTVRQLSQGDGLLKPQTTGGARRDARPEAVAQGEVLAEGVPCVK